MSFDDLFLEADVDNTPVQTKSLVDKIIEQTREEYFSYGAEEQSRIDEETKIKNEIKVLQKKLSQLKNIKNVKLRHLNEDRSKQRKQIKNKISSLHVRLQEINMEREDK